MRHLVVALVLIFVVSLGLYLWEVYRSRRARSAKPQSMRQALDMAQEAVGHVEERREVNQRIRSRLDEEDREAHQWVK